MRYNMLVEYREVGDRTTGNFVYYKGFIFFAKTPIDQYEAELEELVEKFSSNVELDLSNLFNGYQDHVKGLYTGVLSSGGVTFNGGDEIEGTDVSTSNKELMKIAKHLGFDSFSIDTAGEVQMKFDHIPEKWYHGTTLGRFKQMLKSGGLKPSSMTDGEKSFEISNDEMVFITSSKYKAAFHATHASQMHGSVPLIIALKIPDESNVVVDLDSGSRHYPEFLASLNKEYTDFSDTFIYGGEDIDTDAAKLTINKILQTGVVGYKGRIPKSFFEFFLTIIPEIHWFGDLDDYLETYIQEPNLMIDDMEHFKSFNELLKSLSDRYWDEFELELLNNPYEDILAEYGEEYDLPEDEDDFEPSEIVSDKVEEAIEAFMNL